MLFDDRLATVLRNAAPSEPGARTQYRQLLDLLGSLPAGASSELAEAAYERLGELADALPQAVQSAILRAPGLRLRNRALVAWLANGEPQAAAAAMATARLDESDWLYLIPRLPMTARGFLRHRRDLPFSARQVLDRLGVKDLVLPEPAPAPMAPDLDSYVRTERPPGPEPADLDAYVRIETGREATEPALRPEAEAGIGALVRRIEAFQRARREGAAAPRLPLGDAREPEPEPRVRAFDFACDARGTITWADPAMAPLVVGMTFGEPNLGAVAVLDDIGARAILRHQPLRGARVRVAGPAEIGGAWQIDAAPVFTPRTGHFAGYQGRMRRPMPALAQSSAHRDGTADRMRQLLHELRTPVNAIQGFAELIQQQMFGSAPNEYRALAAAVAVDAARVMAGLDEIDRLARLETGALQLDEGESDLREMVSRTLRRLEGVLRPRSARIELVAHGSPFTVGMGEGDAMLLAWRVLATLAGALAPGEIVDVALAGDGTRVTLDADLPAGLAGNGDPFAASAPAQPRAISAGMFGTGFTLRLARAEAESIGGTLERQEDRVRLVLPALTGHRGAHTLDRQGNGG